MTVSVIRSRFLSQFTCLGALCEDTCCKGWNMQVDEPTRELYNTKAPELMESLSGTGTQTIMRRDPQTDHCVKFSDGLCGIQKQYGEDFLGDACHFYPRSVRKLGEEMLMTATLSCPEIVRLALLRNEDSQDTDAATMERTPYILQNYLPAGITAKQALAIHKHFLQAMKDTSVSPGQCLMRIYVAAESLERIPVTSWPDAVPFYLQHADTHLPSAKHHGTDTIYLLQALCGLVAAAKHVHHARMMQTIAEMESALHISIRWDTLAIASLPDSAHAINTLWQRWNQEWRQVYSSLLARYVSMQLSLAIFPFAGFGNTLSERIAIIGIRFATVRLALMSLCSASSPLPEEKDIVRVIQSLSRFLDHLAEPKFSLQIYKETGWLQRNRLAAIVADSV